MAALVHWWVPGLVHDADPMADATGEPDRVTCPACLAYVDQRCASIGQTPQQVGERVRAVFR